MQLFSVHSLNILSLVSDDIGFVNTFCKKANSGKSGNDLEFSTNTLGQTLEIAAVCTSVFNFQNPEFSFFSIEDNFKEYLFSDSLHLNIFLDRHLLPPRV